MKRLAFAACIAMAGCAASPIEVAQQKCAAEPDATRERCLVTTAQAEHQSYANARAAGAQAAADSYRPPIETTCRQAPGGVTRCTTY
jgi:esterase/lipase superfamily enzyme